MPTDDAPRTPLDVIPAFRAPAPSQPDPDLPKDPPGPTASPGPGPAESPRPWSPNGSGLNLLGGPRSRRPDAEPTPTVTSASTGDRPSTRVSAGDMAMVVAGGLAVLGMAAAALIRWQLRRKLRQPTKRQCDQMAAPIARIVVRHGALRMVPEDLGDVLELGAAIGNYINDDAPLLSSLTPDPGPMPQEETL